MKLNKIEEEKIKLENNRIYNIPNELWEKNIWVNQIRVFQLEFQNTD